MTEPSAASPAAPPPRRRWKLIVLVVLLVPVLFFGIYTWTALHWSYSEGSRSGTLQKFSRKGWTCKTYEGELWQTVVANQVPTIWNFTVRDEWLVKQMDTMVGKEVRVHYTEHRGVPFSCFGDTPYYVDSVTAVK